MALTTAQKAKTIELAADIAIQYEGDVIPPMANLTPQGAIDQIGALKEAQKMLEKTENILWNRLSALQGGGHPTNSQGVPVPDPVAGDTYFYTVAESDREAINQTKAKEYFSNLGILNDYMSVTTVSSKSVKRQPGK